MLGFNWIDLIIVLMLAVAVITGIRIGFLTQFFTFPAFFATLFLAGWLFPHLLPIHDEALKTIVNASLVIIVATYASLRAFDLGQNIHWSLRIGKLQNRQNFKAIEKYAGILPAVIGCLILVWLLGVGIGRLPFEGFSNSVNDSWTVQHLTRALPSVPSVFAQFDKQIDPNDEPKVATPVKPTKSFDYSRPGFESAESKAAESIMRVTSFGCGGIVSGSGFAVGPSLVMTNAHVIAGVKRPIIKYAGSSYEGKPVLFDSGLDIAILQVSDLKAPALKLNKNTVPTGITVAVLGYPGGNYTAVPGLVSDNLDIESMNIYGSGSTIRRAYGILAATRKGSSGSPIVLMDGSVAGMIFSKSTASDNYSYALNSSYLINSLDQAKNSRHRAGTGACAAG